LHTSRLYNKLEGDDNWQLELLLISDCLLELLKLMVQATSMQPSSSNEIEGNDDNIEIKTSSNMIH
jgi:hypothetical protein